MAHTHTHTREWGGTLGPGFKLISTQDRSSWDQVAGCLGDVILILVEGVHSMELEEHVVREGGREGCVAYQGDVTGGSSCPKSEADLRFLGAIQQSSGKRANGASHH